VSLPTRGPGFVARYNDLWADTAARAREEGNKDRPAVIVLAIDGSGTAKSRVYVLPITHSAPPGSAHALEIPRAVARTAGLDTKSSWVILSEFNEFVWPGFDLGLIPGRSPLTFAYGFLTPGFFALMRDRWLALDAAGKTRGVARD